jgi:hypothetical protein
MRSGTRQRDKTGQNGTKRDTHQSPRPGQDAEDTPPFRGVSRFVPGLMSRLVPPHDRSLGFGVSTVVALEDVFPQGRNHANPAINSDSANYPDSQRLRYCPTE